MSGPFVIGDRVTFRNALGPAEAHVVRRVTHHPQYYPNGGVWFRGAGGGFMPNDYLELADEFTPSSSSEEDAEQ